MSCLRQVGSKVQRFAEAVASALKVEVEILDDQLYRLGATGRVRGLLRVKQKRGFVNSHVLATGQPFTFSRPGEHRVCDPCDARGDCIYTAGLFCPIIYDGKSVGVMSLIGFDEAQRDIILGNEVSYLDFMARMCDLLATMVSEHHAMRELERASQQLDTAINAVSEGIVSVDERGTVTCFNKAAGRILGLASGDLLGRPLGEILPSSLALESLGTGAPLAGREVTYNAGGRPATLLSAAYPLKAGGRTIGAVESFSEVLSILRAASRMTTAQGVTRFEDIKGCSRGLSEVKEKALIVAAGSSTVLLQGESGTGKELFARAIHEASPRRKEPFQVINCSAIPESLLESELFGYEEGAFTGARHGGKPGKLELANGGTLFLDEVGEMPIHLQPKMLRVLQERCVERVGSTKPTSIDVRIIAATNALLEERVKEGLFRADLFYRLNVIPLHIPPLRDRPEDIHVLLEHFLSRYSQLLGKPIRGLSEEAKGVLTAYHWPGNVRELQNVMEYAVNFEKSRVLQVSSLPSQVKGCRVEEAGASVRERLARAERDLLLEALRGQPDSVEGKRRVARSMGISLSTLYRMMKRLGVPGHDGHPGDKPPGAAA
jgi:transcriptional regulator with PAS, ATPase and Fis domain